MQKHDCTKGSDGIWSCAGRQGLDQVRHDLGQQAAGARRRDHAGAGEERGDRVRPRQRALAALLPAGSRTATTRSRSSRGSAAVTRPARSTSTAAAASPTGRGTAATRSPKLLRQSDEELNPAKRARSGEHGGRDHGAERPDAADRTRSPRILVYKTKIHGHQGQLDQQGPRQHGRLVGQLVS